MPSKLFSSDKLGLKSTIIKYATWERRNKFCVWTATSWGRHDMFIIEILQTIKNISCFWGNLDVLLQNGQPNRVCVCVAYHLSRSAACILGRICIPEWQRTRGAENVQNERFVRIRLPRFHRFSNSFTRCHIEPKLSIGGSVSELTSCLVMRDKIIQGDHPVIFIPPTDSWLKIISKIEIHLCKNSFLHIHHVLIKNKPEWASNGSCYYPHYQHCLTCLHCRFAAFENRYLEQLLY